MTKLIIRKAHERTRKPTMIDGLSKTIQSAKAECDIHTILKNYQKTGLLQHVSEHKGDYSDLSEVVDFQTAQNILLEANTAFDSLPSQIRKKFDNDPGKFLAFAENPDNLSSMQEMGLIDPPAKAPAPLDVNVVTPKPEVTPDAQP